MRIMANCVRFCFPMFY